MHGLLEQVLKSPRLVDFQTEIVRTLDVERTERAKFREKCDKEARAEFINGEVVEQVSNKDMHTVCLDFIATLLATFVRLRKLGSVRTEQSLTEFPRNDYCPDICFWPSEARIGLDPRQQTYPPPAFIVEVTSSSTERRDRGVKFEDYEAHGVLEYWIVDPEKRTIEQYLLTDGQYKARFHIVGEVIRSAIVEGFQMPVEAAFDDRVQLAELQRMLQAG